ncbi:hypothetical protein QCA50_003849 [Cerrena zonata]|uniref:Peptidase A1 domain-containing protein n=1 Tax=Cerrena zonata TaxID=2478898 RepID=A0AAW0GMB5_9APHY
MSFMRSDIKTDLRAQFSILIHPSINVAALAYQFDVDSKSGRCRTEGSSSPSSSARTLDPMSMLAFLLLAIALLCHSGHCLRLSLQEHVGDLYPYHGVIKSGGYDKRIAKVDENLDNKNEIFYSINISVNGKSLAVQLDTGGTDLWIVPPSDFHIGNTSKIATSLSFASGGTVQGNVSFAEVGIDTMQVQSQALVYARHTKYFSSLFKAGMHGIWGLGFEQSSTILHNTRTAFGDKDNRGLTFFGNLFAQNKTLSNFFTVVLGRKDDPDGLVDGAFTIGEFDPRYKNITSQPKLFTTSSQSSGQLAQFPIWAVKWMGCVSTDRTLSSIPKIQS